MRLKAESSKVTGALKQLESTIEHLKKHPTERWQTIRQITKQLNSSHHVPSSKSVHSHPASPAWTQRMESLFGPINDQLRLIKCDNCGILTKENNSKVGVTHKLNCEILRKSSGSSIGPNGLLNKKFGLSNLHFSNLESNSKKRGSSEVSLDTNPLKKKKKTTIIDHTTSSGGHPDGPNVINGVPMTQKQIKKALAAAERLERENERKEKKRIEEEARKAKKLSRAKGGPVNVNEQCGVLLPPNDTPCARSLTCKTHSMGAKRSVPGRSAPYDVLLNEWQKKNNPNWGDRKVVTPRVGPGIEPGISKKKKKELASLANKNNNNNQSNSDKNGSNGDQSQENDNSNNNNQVKNQSSGNSTQGQVVNKSTTSNSTKSSGQAKSNTGGGGGGGSQGGGTSQVTGTNKKTNHPSSQSLSKTGGTQTSTSSTKLSAANEAKLLGELDADFYLIVPPPKKSSSSSSKLQQKSTPIDVDGDTVMGGEPPDHHPHQLDSEGEEDRSDNESDSEFEAVLKGLIISQNFLRKPCSFSSSSSSAVNCWSKFSKLGVRESFANSFKM
ncbi:hypothetical protein Pst134EA_023113 [Puccinia striiformis f. sp. tritici]|uniref:hypothetical protein n=1 Tax=Puccinia striiformis f. sp. tritici TaxID=168172 RepID=UPI0020089C04|nr:hypothetical protein Pst134EA_023113 [Puccinia striiformis f. sp. tritici]KAH9455655.1 hypothetical protein Pst134EA_023113 [Puccinia striiformis f. sp. tritici]